MLSFLFQGAALGFSAGVSPGPLQTFYFSRAIQNGWRRTLPAAFAPLVSDGPIVALVIGALTQVPASTLSALQIAGGFFILFLGYKALQSFRKGGAQFQASEEKASQTLIQASLMNLLNPNPYIFWSTILGPMVIEAWRVSVEHGLGLILGFYGMMIACSMGLIILFDNARHLGQQVSRWLIGVSGLALLGFGIFQITKGLTALSAG